MAKTVAKKNNEELKKETKEVKEVSKINEVKEQVKEETKVEKQTERKQEPLMDTDEVEIIALIPNVSYEDRATKNMYEWEQVDDVELMDFKTVKNMWRNYKSYFRDMCLKPVDERVIKELGLTRVYDKYEFLMNSENYTEENIDKICTEFSTVQNGLKYSICNKIKNMVSEKELTDITVIKRLENFLNVDLVTIA